MPVMYGEGFVKCSIVAGYPVELCIMFIIIGDASRPCAVLVTRHGLVPCWWRVTAVLVTRDSRVVLIAENNDADEEDNAESEWPERDTRQPSIVVVDQPDDNDYTTDGNIHDGRSAV